MRQRSHHRLMSRQRRQSLRRQHQRFPVDRHRTENFHCAFPPIRRPRPIDRPAGPSTYQLQKLKTSDVRQTHLGWGKGRNGTCYRNNRNSTDQFNPEPQSHCLSFAHPKSFASPKIYAFALKKLRTNPSGCVISPPVGRNRSRSDSSNRPTTSHFNPLPSPHDLTLL